MKKNRSLICNGKKLLWPAIALLCLAEIQVHAGNLTVNNLNVNNTATLYGNLIQTTNSSFAPTNGLILYYSFNTNTNPVPDNSGNGLTGTVYGATWTASGEFGGAYSFNGSSYIDAGNSSNLNPSAIAVSAWFNTTDTTDTLFIVSRDSNSTGRSYAFGVSSGELCGQINGYGILNVTPPYGVTDGNWHHVVYQGSSSLNWQIWLDGSNIYSVGWTAMNVTTTDDYISGRPYTGANNYFNGSIDEVYVYNRTLATNEIVALYNIVNYSSANRVSFGSGVSYTYPLGDISMGIFTNTP